MEKNNPILKADSLTILELLKPNHFRIKRIIPLIEIT